MQSISNNPPSITLASQLSERRCVQAIRRSSPPTQPIVEQPHQQPLPPALSCRPQTTFDAPSHTPQSSFALFAQSNSDKPISLSYGHVMVLRLPGLGGERDMARLGPVDDDRKTRKSNIALARDHVCTASFTHSYVSDR